MNLNYDFNPIIEEYFNGGFSRITVSLTKELLFGIYYDALPDKECVTDFELAQSLGLRPSQIRNLRFRYEQKRKPNLSPEKIILENPATCDADGKWIHVCIKDPYSAEYLKSYLINDRETYAEISLTGETLKIPFIKYVEVLKDRCTNDKDLKNKVNNHLKDFVAENKPIKSILKDTGIKTLNINTLDESLFKRVLDAGVSLSGLFNSLCQGVEMMACIPC